eukprot:m.222539 g.222539  ORF g.222539 m.222539 type:complete len:228 (+) comp16052_c0_seq1:56-739(+)
MSLFSRMFGRAEEAPRKEVAAETAATIQKIQDVVGLLEKKAETYQKKIDQHTREAVRYAKANNKPMAMQHLKRKKRAEEQKKNTEGQIDTLGAQMDALEAMAMNREVIKATEASHHTMKAAMPDADKVQDMLEDQADLMQQMSEISNILASGASNQQVYDEDELAAELDDLMAEDLEGQLASVPAVHDDLSALPDVPTSVPQIPAAAAAAKKNAHAAEAEELANWAS